jgi:hypothetical protein
MATTQPTKEQVRRMRLHSMGVGEAGANARISATPAESSSSSGTSSNVAEGKPMIDIEHRGKKAAMSPRTVLQLAESDSKAIMKIIFDGGGATEEDIRRWYHQGFQFCASPPFGLKQGYGGPCGVLGAVQSELLIDLIFSEEHPEGMLSLPSPSEEAIKRAFASAVSRILARTSHDNYVRLIRPISSLSGGLHQADIDASAIGYCQMTKEQAMDFVEGQYELFQSDSGCIMLVMSLVLTRGIDNVKNDMDMDANGLVGQFGHCSQELINLLLTGYATSNVLDGEVPMGDSGLTLKGVKQRAHVGYLSHLEALRLCQVGSYYKIPTHPVWLVGSSSHFTVLFALDRRINEQSTAETLFSSVQRAFKAVDTDECGFIMSDNLPVVFRKLDREDLVSDHTALERISLKMQMEGGSGVILWSTFWEMSSRLLSGETVDDVVGKAGEIGPSPVEIVDVPDVPTISEPQQIVRTDSDIARELQAQMDGEMDGEGASALMALGSSGAGLSNGNSGLSNGNSAHGASSVQTRERSDSEIARELQAEWDNEIAGFQDSTSSRDRNEVARPSGINLEVGGTAIEQPPASNASTVGGEDAFAPLQRTAVHRHDSFAGEDAEEFTLFHFNGLESKNRPPRLTRFTLAKRASDDAIGQSVAMETPFSGGGLTGAGSRNGAIEEVLRTRWPGCRINWKGCDLPSID